MPQDNCDIHVSYQGNFSLNQTKIITENDKVIKFNQSIISDFTMVIQGLQYDC